jgi:carbon-monoxide dehydrogenase large subunit
VVAVVAETREAARDAVDAVLVEYEELGAVTDVEQATTAGAPALVDRAADNIAAEIRHGDAAAAEAAFARAAVTVALDIVNQRVAPVALEPRSVVASFDRASGAFTVRISNQMPTAVAAGPRGDAARHHAAAGARRRRRRRRRLRHEDRRVSEDIVVAFAARALGRPVHWQSDRSEEFLSASHGRDLTSRAELALDANGKALALRVRSRANVGAYPTPAGSRSS